MVQFSPGVCWLLVCRPGFVVCWVVGVWLCVVVASCVFRVCVVFLFLSVGCRGCVSLSAFWWVLFSVRCFAPPGCLVAGVFPLLCVAPYWCWFMRFLLSWWFLVVVGSPPLFLVRHDQSRLWSCSWFNAECHPGWVAVWCFCSVF